MLHGSALIVIFGLLHFECTSGQQWCYECNTDLTDGLKISCNDPYFPQKVNLTACPQDEPHHCLKSIISYQTVKTTVRSCAPSRQLETYCSVYNEPYPDAVVECIFCENYACNHSHSRITLDSLLLTLLILLGVLNLKFNA